MANGGNEPDDDLDFVYSPEQRPTVEQRIEVLESQLARLRQQIGALMEHFPWLAASPEN